MLRSLYSRLLTTHLLVAVVALSLVGVLSTQLFRHYYVGQTRETLIEAGDQLAGTIARLMREPDADEKVALVIQTATEAVGGRVCVLDIQRGHVMATTDLKSAEINPQLEKLACPATASASIDHAQALCYPGPVISVVAPIRNPKTEEALGVLILRRPLHEVEATLKLATYLIGGSGLIAAALALLLAALASRTIALPLSNMARTASDLAEGDFSARATREGPLELRTVAASLNHMAGSLAAAFSDLSAERERLADILASLDEGVISLDANGNVATVNQGAERLLNRGREELVGSALEDLPVGEESAERLTEVLEGRRDRVLLTVPHADRTLRLDATRLVTENSGAVLVITDITETERLERLRREFVANASHELRAPLTSIRGFIGAVADGTAETEEEKQNCLRVAAQQADLMRRLVDQLLDLSRLQAGVVSFDCEELQPEPLLRAGLDALAPQAAAKGVTLELERDDLPAITVDGDRIMRVLVNLIDNAIRYSPEGSDAEVTARTQAASSAGDQARIVISVRDHGPGIPEEELPSIWERFHRVDKSRQRPEGGAGLGLAIAREIVIGHGGDVAAQNDPDGGARFSFWLPVD